jgi:hypothetical protein
VLVAEERHHEHVLAHLERLRARDARGAEALQVPHLLLRPHAHHLPRVVARVPAPEAVLARDVLVPVAEDEDGGLVDLEREVRAAGRARVVHVRLCALSAPAGAARRGPAHLLARAHAAVDLLHEPAADHLEEDDARARVEHLLARRAVRLVLRVRARARQLVVHAEPEPALARVRLLEPAQPARELRQRRELVRGLVPPHPGRARRRARPVHRGQRRDRRGRAVEHAAAAAAAADEVRRGGPRAYGDVLPEPVVLLREVSRARQRARWDAVRARAPRSAISQSSSSTRASS